MVLSGRSLTMEETPAEEVDNAEPLGDKSRFPTSTTLDPTRILRVYVSIYIHIHIVGYIRKIETRCQTNLIAERRCQADAATTRRLGVSPGRRVLPLYRIVA